MESNFNLVEVDSLIVDAGSDALKLGAAGTPLRTIVPISLSAAFLANASVVFIADRAYQVMGLHERHSVVGGAGALVNIRKITDTSAPNAAASATVKELLAVPATGIVLTNTINTVNSYPGLVALSATLTDLQLAAGDVLTINPGGTVTGVIGFLQIELAAI